MSPHNSPPNLIDIVSQTLNKACKGQAGIRVSEQLSSYTSSSTLYPCRSIDRVLSVATGFASLLEKAKCVKLIQYAKSNMVGIEECNGSVRQHPHKSDCLLH